MVTAFFVLSVATWVFLELYTGSIALAKSSSSNTLAGQLAQEYLTELETNPHLFTWEDFDKYEIGELIPVTLKTPDDQDPSDEKDPIHKVSPPTAMPSTDAAYDRVRNEYRKFMWDANVRLPDENASYVELIVSISWFEKGHLHRIYLTSALPRSIGGGSGS
jgi:hypothetical protein